MCYVKGWKKKVGPICVVEWGVYATYDALMIVPVVES